MAQPPPLPPRKPSQAPLESSSSISQAAPAMPRTPPPLPPRTPKSEVVPEPIVVPPQEVAPSLQTPPRQSGDTGVTVAVTPATPKEERSEPAWAPSASTGVTSAPSRESHRVLDPGPSSPGSYPAAQTAEHLKSVAASSYEKAYSSVPKPDLHTVTHNIPPLSTQQWVTFTSILVALAYSRLSLLYLLVLAAGGYYGLATVHAQTRKNVPTSENIGTQKEKAMGSGDGAEAVGWVNHALYALFPLISTDVLTPFVDLMEDALSEEVPAIITSVRLDSPALGSQPLVLTFMRPLSDQEWFASLSQEDNPSQDNGSPRVGKGHRRAQSSTSKRPLTPESRPGMFRSRSPSNASLPAESLSKTWSSSDVKANDDLLGKVRSRRLHDRLLHKITHRVPDHYLPSDGGSLSSPTSRGDDPDVEKDKEDGTRKRGGWRDEVEEDDPDAGQYVNYQIGFEYKRSEEAMQKGKGLHCLAFMGIGLKGVASAEVPVYIDVLYVKGTINVRLLLSPTPPFVKLGTFSLPTLPEFDIAANPLKKGSFNAMDLPLMKTYVKTSFASVLSSFLRPSTYTLDLDRLLLASAPSSLRLESVGCLHIIFHSATDLPKADTMGSCDPYLEVGFEKSRKPVFSTRTIGNTMGPVWEEECFVLVTADAIESGDILRIRSNDADRFSADDTLGVVLIDLASLIACSSSNGGGLQKRSDPFIADRPGMRASGTLNWSVEFCPLWQMPPEEANERLNASGQPITTPQGPEPSWLTWVKSLLPGDETDNEWLKNRKRRREDAKAWIAGKKEREVLEAEVGASEARLAGILRFHIHQCLDLEIEPTSGTYSSQPLSPGGGPPALAHITDRTSMENSDPPSAYCEVYLNDKMVFKTRTKGVTPMPYFNAVSERFVRDWTKGKIVFVVRDERDREHATDPILGLVELDLQTILSKTSNITRWFPLNGGLGWGRIRLSLLWKSLDLSLPRGISGYEVSTVQIKSLAFTPVDGSEEEGKKTMRAVVRTDSDQRVVDLTPGPAHRDPGEELPTSPTISRSFSSLAPSNLTFTLPPKHHPTLAVMYRHSSSIHVSILAPRSKSRVGRRKRLGAGVIRLGDVVDGEGRRRMGVWQGGGDGGREEEDESDYDSDASGDHSQLTSPNKSNASISLHKTQSLSRIKSHMSKRSSMSSRRSSRKLLGYLDIDWLLVPGISRAHKIIAKKDLRFGKVFEAWEAGRDLERDLSISGHIEEEDEEDDYESDEEDTEGAGNKKGIVSLDTLDNQMGEMSDRRSHSHALHKRHKGVFQLKVARTGRYVKDKISSTVYNATNGGNSDLRAGYGRARGSDIVVEKEGLSSL
ncbi:hypothetical protein I350_04728 [Cryptococcus amylolentus CBS 6273]|uniref:C2 domain-containing protein n=1 Tax=Cryptococcus amylolentus CBS 6273 TaxID=1296118 RepID=A0A1E3JXT5_9TREE|nr:hypothetical protein I350_04728 [Cryptococcus amylolentus CBS 6273]